MFQTTDLAEIATEVARETRLTILDLLNQKYPAMPFDPLRLTTFEERLRNFIFEELCLSLLRRESQEEFLARASLELRRQQEEGSTSIDWDALNRAIKGGDRNA